MADFALNNNFQLLSTLWPYLSHLPIPSKLIYLNEGKSNIRLGVKLDSPAQPVAIRWAQSGQCFQMNGVPYPCFY
jgi:hypothetical protein